MLKRSILNCNCSPSGDRNSAKMKGTIAFFLGLIGSLLALIVALIVIIGEFHHQADAKW
jgi:hypothetical protein